MRFFNSKNVKIFPCSNRGTYSSTVEYEASETLDSVFDLESRLASEYNFTNLPGIINNKKSYVISFEQLPYPITRSKDPAHTHNYNEKGVCSCGVLSSEHTHQFNANNICLNCGWEPDYLLKVVINGYYFEIITKKFPIFTINSGTNLTNDYKSILDSKLWITLQKTSLREADLYDNARHTYQLGSMFARSYMGTYEAEKAKDEQTVANSSNYYLSQHFEILEPGSQQLAIPVSTIINGSIALNILDFPADHMAGSIEKEYYCSAIGITSKDSLEPWVGKEGEEAPEGHFKVLLERESGETETDVVLCCLDLSDPANWLENLAAGEFLYSPDFSGRVEGPEELEVENLFVTSISPVQTKTETGTTSGNLNIQATTIISDNIDTDTIEVDTIEVDTIIKIKDSGTISAPKAKADLEEIDTDKASISELNVPSLECIILNKGTESADDDKTLKAEIDALIDDADTLVKADLRGDLKLVSKTAENGLEADITLPEDVSITSIYGTTPCLATSIDNWSATAEGAWNPAIPTTLTLTGLKKDISCLTEAGGEPNKINTISLGETKLTPDGDKHIDLAGKIKLEHLHTDDKNRVSTLEKIIGKTTFVESTDTSIVAEIADLKDSLKNLDNVMNFIGVISAEELRTYTGKNTYSETKNIEVGDVVVVSAEGGFNYLDKRYEDGTEFICTGVSDSASTWQEIGTCNLTTSSLKQLLGEDIDTNRTGSIKERLCAAENSISNIQDDTTEGTISYRIKTIENAIGSDYTDEESIQVRLTALETLTEDEGEIRGAITINTNAIGDSDTKDTIIYRLDDIETTLVTGATPGSSVLDRLAAVENTLSGTGGDADDNEGETGGSLPERVTALEGNVITIEGVIGTTEGNSETLTDRLNALETNSIVAAAKDITLEDFKEAIKDSVIEDDDFITMVDNSLNTTVEGQVPGKVNTAIETYAATTDFTNLVKSEINSEIDVYAATTDFTDLIKSEINDYAATTDFTGEIDTQISSYMNTDSFKTKVNEVLTGYTLTEPDKTVIKQKASVIAQDYQLSQDDKGVINQKASAVAQEYQLSDTDISKISTKVSSKVGEIDITGQVQGIINQALEDNMPQPTDTQVTSKVSSIFSQAIESYSVDTSKVTTVLNQATEDYEVSTDKVSNTLDTAVTTYLDNITLVALAFDLNGKDFPPILPKVVLANKEVSLPQLTIPEGNEGLSFVGWAVTKAPTTDGDYKNSFSQDTILYAIWNEASD